MDSNSTNSKAVSETIEEAKNELFKKQNPKRALALLKPLLEFNPNIHNALVLEGIALQELGQEGNDLLALESFKRAISIHTDPDKISSMLWERIILHFSRVKGTIDQEDLAFFLKSKPFIRTLVQESKSQKYVYSSTNALKCVAYLWKQYLIADIVESKFPNELKEAILQSYSLNLGETRVLFWELLTTHFIPCYNNKDGGIKGSTSEKSTYLLEFYIGLKNESKKIFENIITHRIWLRKYLIVFLNILNTYPTDEKKLDLIINKIIKAMPITESEKLLQHLLDFCSEERRNTTILNQLDKIIHGQTLSTETLKKEVIELRKAIGNKPYGRVILKLVYRSVEILFGGDFIEGFSNCILKLTRKPKDYRLFDEFGSTKDETIQSGLRFLQFLIYSGYYSKNITAKVEDNLIKLLDIDDEVHMHYIFGCLAKIGHDNQLQLEPWKLNSINSTCEQYLFHPIWLNAKTAVRCLFYNNIQTDDEKLITFKNILGTIESHMKEPDSPICTTAVRILGQIALLFPNDFKDEMKKLVNVILIQQLILNPIRTPDDGLQNLKSWTEDPSELPQTTQNIIYGFKTIVYWLLNVGKHNEKAKKLFGMLIHFVKTSGDEDQHKKDSDFISFNPSEKSWIRLTAGITMLKLMKLDITIGGQYSLLQWIQLSELMIDPEFNVRKKFGEKLVKYLENGFPDRSLQLRFMAYFALAGYETNLKHRNYLKKCFEGNCNLRRNHISSLKEELLGDGDENDKYFRELLPDNIIIYAIPLLTNSSKFTSSQNLLELKTLAEALWFILEPIANHPDFNYQYYMKITSYYRLLQDKINGTPESNHKMWAIGEIIMHLIGQRAKKVDATIPCPKRPKIPPFFVSRYPDPSFRNDSMNYLPGILLRAGAFKRKFQIEKSSSQSEITVESGDEGDDGDDQSGEPGSSRALSKKKPSTPKKERKMSTTKAQEQNQKKPEPRSSAHVFSDEEEEEEEFTFPIQRADLSKPKKNGQPEPTQSPEEPVTPVSSGSKSVDREMPMPKARVKKQPKKRGPPSEVFSDEEDEGEEIPRAKLQRPKQNAQSEPLPHVSSGSESEDREMLKPQQKKQPKKRGPPHQVSGGSKVKEMPKAKALEKKQPKKLGPLAQVSSDEGIEIALPIPRADVRKPKKNGQPEPFLHVSSGSESDSEVEEIPIQKAREKKQPKKRDPPGQVPAHSKVKEIPKAPEKKQPKKRGPPAQVYNDLDDKPSEKKPKKGRQPVQLFSGHPQGKNRTNATAPAQVLSDLEGEDDSVESTPPLVNLDCDEEGEIELTQSAQVRDEPLKPFGYFEPNDREIPTTSAKVLQANGIGKSASTDPTPTVPKSKRFDPKRLLDIFSPKPKEDGHDVDMKTSKEKKQKQKPQQKPKAATKRGALKVYLPKILSRKKPKQDD